jgi:hypothetical protein
MYVSRVFGHVRYSTGHAASGNRSTADRLECPMNLPRGFVVAVPLQQKAIRMLRICLLFNPTQTPCPGRDHEERIG